jgi:hypothetical protein
LTLTGTPCRLAAPPRIPLSQPLPSFQLLANQSLTGGSHQPIEIGRERARVTTLPNGVRVVTRSSPGPLASTGILIDAGSRHETPVQRGAAKMVERMIGRVRQLSAVAALVETLTFLIRWCAEQ